jgi:hypothetical protein
MTDIEVIDNKLKSITINGNEKLETEELIIAI